MKNEEKSPIGNPTPKRDGKSQRRNARLTSLLEQALRSKPEEAKFTAQPEPMLANPHNLINFPSLNMH